ncbi:serine/arginine-rich splicing factor 7-like isoform X3 [Palaemon carinicauda]|uniref:serine/arginine-rich splicing factor 7-like isoform X3 n=1 Tax=Palaemon carinicauda TaxID=392227 RepID=UPI0035B5B5AD
MPSALDCKVYVGDLGSGASKQELEETFSFYGPLRNVWVARNPPGFAFVEFEDVRDAEDAVRGLDGRTICGRRVRVELSTGKSRGRFRGPPPRRGRPFHPEDRCYECGERGHYARDCYRYSRRYSRQNGSDPHSQTSSKIVALSIEIIALHLEFLLATLLELHGLICKAYCLPVIQRRTLSCST